MAKNSIKSRPKTGRFKPGVSGNPSGRPKGTSNHDTELRRLEEEGLALATNTTAVIANTTRLALIEVGRPELIPLIEAITDAAKDSIKDGKIGPSSVALLRCWFEDHRGSDECPTDGAFFIHVGLPQDCSWAAFRGHYTNRKRIDLDRHCSDLFAYSPITQAIKALTAKAA
jgi:hypothetical protein